MKTLIRKSLAAIWIVSLIGLSTSALALEEFVETGVIQKKTINGFQLKGESYRVSPKVKVEVYGKKGKLDDLNVGDIIWLQGVLLSESRLVDKIVLHRIDDE